MLKLTRAPENPILAPNSEHDWEYKASFNPCVVYHDGVYHMLYRALSPKQAYYGVELELSTIGHATSTDGIHFTQRQKFIKPEHDWEFYGCEDPRITKVGDTFYIFYTALSTFPFSAPGIKVGVALTKDFKTIEEKHLVTPFNAKAMSLFPEKVNGKIAAILTANTDLPPSKISIAYFDKMEEVWSKDYWDNWYSYIDDHALHLQRNDEDHVELGAPPIKTERGWLLIYSYIKNYYSDRKIFGIEGLVLDANNPIKIISRTDETLLIPEEKYEREGMVPDIVFPTGALTYEDKLSVYYGGADTVSCLATCKLSELLKDMQPEEDRNHATGDAIESQVLFHRFEENPILRPLEQHEWEKMAAFNPASFFAGGKVNIVYRASSGTNISTFGLATSIDGFHISERLSEPIYIPRENFEKNNEGKNYGCEDPRITEIDDRFYMCYTAYNGHELPRVAITSISVQDFLQRKWNWDIPKLISPPGIDDKDACLLSRKINGKYAFLHRMQLCIWIDFIDTLEFSEGKILTGDIIIEPRPDKWDSNKIGIAAPPVETKDGWLLLYHGIDTESHYSVGALLLDLENPKSVLARLDYPVFTPETVYEKEGIVPNVVFPCGTVVLEGNLIIYYGGADKVVGAASVELSALLEELLKSKV